ncbi:MAG TPA: type II toxin-antitoxin system HipA family toxin [Acidimicrobiales bacterium]|nr:type II toxin-antitoxin system HipA family toxin [Acidimicrobiales bacterium]
MSYRPTDVIEVVAWGRRVGAVARDPDTGWYAFAYDRDWVSGGFELAPLHMPLRPEPYQFPELRPETFHRLPALIADALPDAFGNALVDAWMAEQGVAAGQITPLDRLAYAADRAMGVLEFRPPARDPAVHSPTAVQLADLVLAARLTVSGGPHGGATAHAALQQLIQVGTSAGGARAKAVVSFNPATFQVRSAYGPPADGFEQWLIKLDGVSATGVDGHGDRLGDSAPYGRVEYAYSLMAVAAGVEMAPCQMLAEGPRRHFMTRRFDRGDGGERHHVISLCALAHLDFNLVATHSYDQYLQTAVALGLEPAERQQAYRRMVFNVMAVNRDDHTKNFAFLREEHGGWRLAPAYDVTHAYRPDSRWTGRHLMAVNGRFDGITLDDLHAVGERNDVPGYRRVVRDVADGVAAWPQFAARADLDEQTTESVAEDIARFRPT